MLYVLSKWLFLGTFNAVVSYAERETRPAGITKRRYRVCAPFLPFHLFYFIAFVINFFTNIGFHCRDSMNFPLILFLLEVVSLMTNVAIWIVHGMNWKIQWSKEGLDYRQQQVLDIFRAQTKRLFCWSIWVTILSVSNIVIVSFLFRKDKTVMCNDDGEQFLFSTCGLQALFMMAHNFTTM